MNQTPVEQHLVDETSISKFDQDYINDKSLDGLMGIVNSINPDIREVADFGGGNGRFLDRLLMRLPYAHGTNYEISEHLRFLNTKSTRKSIKADSFLSINEHSIFDLITINWVLHHLVGNNLTTTTALINKASEVVSRTLRPGGVLIVSENLLQSVIPERFSSAALYGITRSKLLKPLITRMRDGAAVAGVGVYYLSEPQLLSIFRELEHVATFTQGVHNYGWKLKLIGISQVCEKILIFKKSSS